MNLLICTQKVDKNDQNLGFFHRWIIEFSKQFEQVTVICLYRGEYDLPKNVKVLSLGKEEGVSRLKYLGRFYGYIWKERKNYDKVFVHMNQIYVILGGILWRMWGKKISLWYTHRMVGTTLRIATKLAHAIFTASKESFRLPTSKVNVMGHGIDADIFSPSQDVGQHRPYTLISISRISSSKNQLTMAETFKILKDKGFKSKLLIVGHPISAEDYEYKEKVEEYIREQGMENDVTFEGASKPEMIIEFYHKGDLFINLSSTGSLDKAVLEAMACGLQIVTSNEAFKKIVPEKNYTETNPELIAQKIIALSKEKADPALRKFVVEKNNIYNLIPALSEKIRTL